MLRQEGGTAERVVKKFSKESLSWGLSDKEKVSTL